jgi:hypothetical protein
MTPGKPVYASDVPLVKGPTLAAVGPKGFMSGRKKMFALIPSSRSEQTLINHVSVIRADSLPSLEKVLNEMADDGFGPSVSGECEVYELRYRRTARQSWRFRKGSR